MTLVLDDDGHLARSTVAGAPSTALRHGIDRTMALKELGRAQDLMETNAVAGKIVMLPE